MYNGKNLLNNRQSLDREMTTVISAFMAIGYWDSENNTPKLNTSMCRCDSDVGYVCDGCLIYDALCILKKRIESDIDFINKLADPPGNVAWEAKEPLLIKQIRGLQDELRFYTQKENKD